MHSFQHLVQMQTNRHSSKVHERDNYVINVMHIIIMYNYDCANQFDLLINFYRPYHAAIHCKNGVVNITSHVVMFTTIFSHYRVVKIMVVKVSHYVVTFTVT